MRKMRRSALVVTGLNGEGGISEDRMIKDLRRQGYYVRVTTWHEYRDGEGNAYDVVLGHSMGGARIQTDKTLPDSKIQTFQAPVQIRGTHHSTTADFLNLTRIPRGEISSGGHSYQSGQFNQPRKRY